MKIPPDQCPGIVYEYNEGLSAAGTAENIQAAYGEEAIRGRAAKKWSSCFREGNFDLSDGARSGKPSDFDEERLNALAHEDIHNTRQANCLERWAAVTLVVGMVLCLHLVFVNR
ncbi:hypothetical protein M513_02308 [Trichuris suis]|uniref:Mos1 transposase HTH domain-containing protein n=1 Tax=Trichuris suis TaxID=68888 RepID=A0A085MHD6_9BILA|nr:hypothetical protein M513_02308 [Trichuris suis]